MKKAAYSSIIALVLASIPCSAVIVSGGRDGHTSAAGAGDGWGYVGQIGAASGVYLGEYGGSYWVLTNVHVGTGSFNVNGTSYGYIQDSATRIGNADLMLFRIDVPQGSELASKSNLKLADHATTIASGSVVTMIGHGGASQSSTPTSWRVEEQGDQLIWHNDLNDPGVLVTGYGYTGGAQKSWGTNTIEDYQYVFPDDPAQVSYTRVAFDNINGEAQGVVGDSGGGVFYIDPETNEVMLLGLMTMIATYNGQPGGYAVHGNETLILPTVNYIDEINRILSAYAIPEPSTGIFTLTGALFLLFCRKRRQQR